MTRQSIGEALAARLYAAEAAIDRALAETAAATIGALAEARGHLVQTHTTLTALARKLGLDALASGPIDKPGDTPPVGGGLCPEGDTVHGMVNKSLPTTSELC